METETPAPAAVVPHPADRAAAVLVWVGNLMHSIGASMLRARHAELAAELDDARQEIRKLSAVVKWHEDRQAAAGGHQDPVPVDVDGRGAGVGDRVSPDVAERYEDAR